MPSPRILVVDHSAPIAEYVEGILENEGYVVRVCNSSDEALSEGSRYKPSLLIIDPIMPGLSGVEVATRMSNGQSCKVLFLSSLADDSDFKDVIKGIRQQGCDAQALPKPFEKDKFLDCVRRAVGVPTLATTTPSSGQQEAQPEREQKSNPAIEEPPTKAAATSEYADLMKMVGLNLYRGNAFRITGLGITSSLREVTREAEKLEMMINLGTVRPAGGLFPLKEPPSAIEIRSAVQVLKDPELRLLHEFFWFWPSTEVESDDPALQALRSGKHSAAMDMWTQVRGPAGGIAVHNLAVLYHLEAVGTYLRRLETKSLTKPEDLYLWTSAFRYWKALLDRSDFWSVLADRIRLINDPRLTIEVAQQIWNTLPNALLKINAEVAVAAAEKGEFEEAGVHRRLMFTSAFGESVAKKELLRALAPLGDELKQLCDGALRDTRTNRRNGDKVVRRLLDEKSRLLQAFNYLLGVGDATCAEAHDLVARTARSCIVDYVNETDDWETGRVLTEECLAVAEGQDIRAKLEEDLEVIGRNLTAARQTTQANTSQHPRGSGGTSVKPSEPTSPRSPAPVKRKISYKLIGLAAIVLLVLWGSLKDSNDSNHPASGSNSGYGATNSEPVSSSADQGTASSSRTVGTPSYSSPVQSNPFRNSNSKRDELKAEIDNNRAALDQLESELKETKSNMESVNAELNADKASLDRMEQDNRLGLDVDKSEYESTRQRHNSNVNIYNGWVRSYNEKRGRYKQLLNETNDKIAQFNSMGESR
jgi:DNA-binding response OmpR family regulator